MNRREVVLCVGMHRSGTSLTASMLQCLGLSLPGELIAADPANPTGYFENRSIVDAQEQLLKDLGYWWPSESASFGMPSSVVTEPEYLHYVDWLTEHLDQLFYQGDNQIVVKDPRTSLLMPAWLQVSKRLRISLRVVICIRNPRDVCWSLVCRDGSSVGMSWSRAQRLWIRHYKNLLHCLKGIPSFVVRYEHWLDPHFAFIQLNALAEFVGQKCTSKTQQFALGRIRPELNHGGINKLPPVDLSLRCVYSLLILPRVDASKLSNQIDFFLAAFKISCLIKALRERLHILWLKTPLGCRELGAVIDSQILFDQLGTTSFRAYRRSFHLFPDLRPHPLISPLHLNRERSRCCLPPIKTADELFRYLLYPDLLLLNTHPWFDCREHLIRFSQIGQDVQHPVLTFVSASHMELKLTSSECWSQLSWLFALGAHRDPQNEQKLPEVISCLHPGLVVSDPIDLLGDPDDGPDQLIANERYWHEIHTFFENWPDSDPEIPLTWLRQQPRVDQLGLTDFLPANGYQLWWVTGDWEAKVLGTLAGVEFSQCREFPHPDLLYTELQSFAKLHADNNASLLIALTPSLFELFLAFPIDLPDGVGFLNLMWPNPSQQSSWLHLLAKATLLVECRPAVRSFFLGLGFQSQWPRPMVKDLELPPPDSPTLLLATFPGLAEAQLSAVAPSLDAFSYNAYFRLDAELQLHEPLAWLSEKRSYRSWLWLNSLPSTNDLKGHSVFAWAHHHGVTINFLPDPPSQGWWSTFTK